MRTWDKFYPLVLPWSAGAFEGSVDDALRQAAIEFCQYTLAWQRMLPDIVTQAGVASYALPLGVDDAVAKVLALSIGGTPGQLLAPQQLDHLDRIQGSPVAGYTADGVELTLHPVPAQSGSVVSVRAALKPSQSAAGVDDVLHEQHAEAIAAGALKRLCQQPGRPYSNPGLAAANAEAFEAAKRAARLSAFKGRARTTLRAKPVYF